MSTATYRQVFVLGKEVQGNRELKVVNVGDETDLPAAAEFYYTDVSTRFPYEVSDTEL